MSFHNFDVKQEEPRILECIHCKSEVAPGIFNLINHLEQCKEYQKTDEAAFVRAIMHAGDPWRKPAN